MDNISNERLSEISRYLQSLAGTLKTTAASEFMKPTIKSDLEYQIEMLNDAVVLIDGLSASSDGTDSWEINDGTA